MVKNEVNGTGYINRPEVSTRGHRRFKQLCGPKNWFKMKPKNSQINPTSQKRRIEDPTSQIWAKRPSSVQRCVHQVTHLEPSPVLPSCWHDGRLPDKVLTRGTPFVRTHMFCNELYHWFCLHALTLQKWTLTHVPAGNCTMRGHWRSRAKQMEVKTK